MKYSSHNPLAWIEDELSSLYRRGLSRELRAHAGPQQVHQASDDGELISFGSNDYLGLAADPRLAEAAAHAAQEEGWGAGASPLVTGRRAGHERLERRLADFEGTSAAIVFGSGYAANLGAIAALADRPDAIFADARNHASMIDGCRLSRAGVNIYPHRDWQALAEMLADAGEFRRRLIVTESVFSMDGDLAPLVELVELAERFDCMLLVDEAHATGVLGRGGRGLAEALGVEDRVHIRLGTLSKALGSSGGFVCGSEPLIAWLANRARPYIFSTALPAALCAAAAAALDIVEQEPWRRQILAERVVALRAALADQDWHLGTSNSQIIPLVIGEADQAMRMSARLQARGMLVPAIRPPSVPQGESLLRISLSCAHTPAMLDALTSALDQAREETAQRRPVGV